MLNGLDLFSGIGGITLALEPWVRPIAYCENDRYAQSVLLSKMGTGNLPTAPIWDDVRSLSASFLPPVDIVTGGFPCQDISVAGTGKGLEGKRSGLFFEIIRLCRDIRPTFVFLENVPAITVRGLDQVVLEFTALGYNCRWTVVSAEEVGAPHLRERWFILANTNNPGCFRKNELQTNTGRSSSLQQRSNSFDFFSNKSCFGDFTGTSEGHIKPEICGTGDGIPHRSHRLRGLGNAVVPLQARTAFQRLMGL